MIFGCMKALKKIYIGIEAVLLIALLTLQVWMIASGDYVWDKSAPLFPYTGALKVSLTAVSFLTVLLCFFFHRKQGISLLDLLTIYFLFTLTADVFFSFSTNTWVPHLCFAIVYFLFLFIRKGKWMEILIPLIVGTIAFLLLWLVLKKEPILSLIDSFLGAALLTNVVFCWINYAKTKKRLFLLFALGVTAIFVSDLSIALSSSLKQPMFLNHIFGMMNWPFYVPGNVCIVLGYLLEKENA